MTFFFINSDDNLSLIITIKINNPSHKTAPVRSDILAIDTSACSRLENLAEEIYAVCVHLIDAVIHAIYVNSHYAYRKCNPVVTTVCFTQKLLVAVV